MEVPVAHTTRRSDPRAAKVRDITRSVLPSIFRQAAGAKLTSVRRRHRHAVARAVSRIPALPCTCALDPDDTCPRCDVDPWVDYPRSEHLEAIDHRRIGDKLGPLLRWGAAEARGLHPYDAYHRIRPLLDATPMGAHALSHLALSDVVDPDPGGRWWGPREERPASLAELAGWALDAGHHRLLNDVCRHHARHPRSYDPPAVPSRFQQLGDGRIWRPLRHRGDVEAWAADVARLGVSLWIWENLRRERERLRSLP
jgi:hypothetical protein